METIQGSVQLGVRGDYDKDGKEDAILALGSSKTNRDAAMELLLISNSGIKTIWKKKSKQNMITDLHFVDDNIFFVHSENDGKLHSAWITIV